MMNGLPPQGTAFRSRPIPSALFEQMRLRADETFCGIQTEQDGPTYVTVYRVSTYQPLRTFRLNADGTVDRVEERG